MSNGKSATIRHGLGRDPHCHCEQSEAIPSLWPAIAAGATRPRNDNFRHSHCERSEAISNARRAIAAGAARLRNDSSRAVRDGGAPILYAKETPDAGGDTLFANMYLAYDALSDPMKDLLKGIKTWNVGDRIVILFHVIRRVRRAGLHPHPSQTRRVCG
jgi:hypothetical protein